MIKKILRVTAFALSVILLCSVFTGCNQLDAMKSAHGYINEDGSIVFNTNRYLLITGAEIHTTSTFNPFMVMDKVINITEPDVPVLLSFIFAEKRGYVSSDGIYLYTYSDKNDFAYYCREDKLDEILERLKESFIPEVLAYHYEIYDPDSDRYTPKTYILTDEQKRAVEDVVATIEPQQVDNYYVYDSSYCCNIYECSKDLLFNRYVLTIECLNDQYTITKETGDGFTEKYSVPNELYPIFSEIMEKHLIANEIYTEPDAGVV